MNVGTKSLLFGVHQFLWHPWTVAKAWRMLYGSWPTWKQAVCIFFHDWGYWGKPNMDGPEGKTHPEGGAKIVDWIMYRVYRLMGHSKEFSSGAACMWWSFTIRHSSATAKELGEEPSALYYADKACVLCEPEWLYLLRAKASGEVWEYIQVALDAKVWPEFSRWFFCECLTKNEQAKTWLRWYKRKTLERVKHESSL